MKDNACNSILLLNDKTLMILESILLASHKCWRTLITVYMYFLFVVVGKDLLMVFSEFCRAELEVAESGGAAVVVVLVMTAVVRGCCDWSGGSIVEGVWEGSCTSMYVTKD